MISDHRRLTLVLGGGCVLFTAAVLLTVNLADRRARPRPPAGSKPIAAVGPGAGGTARHRLDASEVLGGFARSYLAYLDGGPVSRLRYASITAASQVKDGGRIPPAFRDGALRITSSGEQGQTGWSAQATVVAGNRSESYPFTVQMLYEQNGWQIAQVLPVDLSTDDHIHPPVGVIVPAAGSAAARWFAVAYVTYRAADTRTPPRMESDAAESIAQETDPLAQTRMPHGRAALASISYGPPSGREFAATATVRIAGQPETFSFLMVKARDGWVCGAFL